MSAALGLMARLRTAMDVVYREILKFGAVGALAYVVDVYVYNLLRTGWWPLTEAPLAHKPLLAKVFSVAVATVVAWLGNRYWTFRRRRRAAIRQEFVLFVVMNVGGLLIAAGCIGFSHYVLDLRSALADNISGNVVGLGLGTLFRFWAYRTFVFTDLGTTPTGDEVGTTPTGDEVGTTPTGNDLADPATPAVATASTAEPVPSGPRDPRDDHTDAVLTPLAPRPVQRNAANRRRTA